MWRGREIIFFFIGILFFLLLRSPCKISEPYTNQPTYLCILAISSGLMQEFIIFMQYLQDLTI